MNYIKDKIIMILTTVIALLGLIAILLWDSLKAAVIKEKIETIKDESKKEVEDMTAEEKETYLNSLMEKK